MNYKAVIFDMDGTILDTLEDLQNAFCYALEQGGHRSDYTKEEVSYFIGSGALVALRRALAYEAGTALEDLLLIGSSQEQDPSVIEEASRMVEIFMEYYPEHSDECTKAFPGLPEALDALREADVRLAVVSNKFDSAVQDLAEQYFPGRFDFAIGVSDKYRRKPFPDMIDRCLQVMNVDPEEAVYVGDSEIDLQTAAGAGIPCISVTWGNRSEAFLRRLGAECIIRDPGELTKVIL